MEVILVDLRAVCYLIVGKLKAEQKAVDLGLILCHAKAHTYHQYLHRPHDQLWFHAIIWH